MTNFDITGACHALNDGDAATSAGPVVSVTVTFNPAGDALLDQMRVLVPQVSHAIIVDNGSSLIRQKCFEELDSAKVSLVKLGDNRGIASAQNIGITMAREMGARYVLLMDQDSMPDPQMVVRLVDAAIIASAGGARVASVGPWYDDHRYEKQAPFVRLSKGRLTRVGCDTSDAIVPVDHLIASGCLILVDAFEKVGLMSEELFIDYVDIEWSMRARYCGFASFGVCSAKMLHSLGEEPVRVLGRTIPMKSPIRYYYAYRNAIWMYRQPWIRVAWKRADAYRMILKFGFYLLFARPRIACTRLMLLGVVHGLRGKMGKLIL